jgi:hypothetical protein
MTTPFTRGVPQLHALSARQPLSDTLPALVRVLQGSSPADAGNLAEPAIYPAGPGHPQSSNRRERITAAFWKQAVRDGIIDRNPAIVTRW